MTEEATVDITIGTGDDAQSYRLAPKLSAMKAINRYAGGYVGMYRALQNFDADAMVLVIAAATGANGKQATKIEERLYATGIQVVQPEVLRFVNICANGGREPEPEKTGDGAATGSAAGNA